MSRAFGCPERLPSTGIYHCELLQVDRQSTDERICDICDSFIPAKDADPLLELAYQYARTAHAGQYRKGTNIPYMIHLIRTWGYVQQMTSDLEEQAAALLHDVLEDTSATVDSLSETFGKRITDLIVGESEYKREEKPANETWALRKSETIKRLRGRLGQRDVKASMDIAFADKLANLYSMCFEYMQVGDRIWEKFNQKDKGMHAWYYGEMGKIFDEYFTEGIEAELMEEYKMLYRDVFKRGIDQKLTPFFQSADKTF